VLPPFVSLLLDSRCGVAVVADAGVVATPAAAGRGEMTEPGDGEIGVGVDWALPEEGKSIVLPSWLPRAEPS
jgi:hypothetical protein